MNLTKQAACFVETSSRNPIRSELMDEDDEDKDG